MTFFTGARTIHLIECTCPCDKYLVVIGNISIGYVTKEQAEEIKSGIYKVNRAYGDNPK